MAEREGLTFLDADVCIDLIRGQQKDVERHFARALAQARPLALSIVTLHELWVGVAGGGPGEEAKVKALRSQTQLIEWKLEDALAAGAVRADLIRRGCKIGDLDILLAGQALVQGAIVATANARHFGRVGGLRIENWRAGQSA